MSEFYSDLRRYLEEERLCAVATVLTGDRRGFKVLLGPQGELDSYPREERLQAVLGGVVASRITEGRTERVQVERDGEELDVFVEVHLPPRRLLIVGAVHVAIPLVEFANRLGFRTVVIDPRPIFATAERFPHASELLVEWPDEALARLPLNENTFVAVLSHDSKLDDPALKLVLSHPVRYVGALGSKRTHAKRVKSLGEMGVPPEQIERIHAPIGIKLGGRKPEEIAVSIIAEIVAVANHCQIQPGDCVQGSVGRMDSKRERNPPRTGSSRATAAAVSSVTSVK